MAISDYLASERVVYLRGKTKAAAFAELAERVSGARPGVSRELILEELWKRESFLSTRVSENMAIPHAIIRSMSATIMAVGISREGIPYEDTKGDLPVQILVMLVGGESDHLSALSEIASRLSNDSLRRELLLGRSGEELFELLAGPDPERSAAASAAATEALFAHALALSTEVGATRLVVHADATSDTERIGRLCAGRDAVIVTSDRSRFSPPAFESKSVVVVPFRGTSRESTIEVSLLFLLSQGLVGKGERIVSVCGIPNSGVVDSIFVTDVDKEFKLYFALDSESGRDGLDQQVLARVLQIANELAVEGREGRPIGTLFVVGDYENVKKLCQQLIVNPFQGYPEEERNVLDPSLEETIKEYSRIDGAFVVRGDGVIMSAGTFIKAEVQGPQIHPGLGARHATAASVTAITRSVAVAISQSTQKISLFRFGERFLHL